jgi:hypothetical protein
MILILILEGQFPACHLSRTASRRTGSLATLAMLSPLVQPLPDGPEYEPGDLREPI